MFENLNWIEMAGYVASIIVAVSLMMNSIVRLRWYNLIGSSLFSIYGFLIKAYPVGFLNGFIAVADIYYLVSMYRKKEYFKVQHVECATEYLHYFLQFFKDDIMKYFPEFTHKNESSLTYFYLLRNISVAGVVAGKKDKDGYFQIFLDYAAPEYRDLKIGRFFFGNTNEYLIKEKIKGYIAHCYNNEHEAYLMKMGFEFIKSSDTYKVFRLDIC